MRWWQNYQWRKFLEDKNLWQKVPPHVCTACGARYPDGLPVSSVGVIYCRDCGATDTLVEQAS